MSAFLKGSTAEQQRRHWPLSSLSTTDEASAITRDNGARNDTRENSFPTDDIPMISDLPLAARIESHATAPPPELHLLKEDERLGDNAPPPLGQIAVERTVEWTEEIV